jgi:hypothetical protein
MDDADFGINGKHLLAVILHWNRPMPADDGNIYEVEKHPLTLPKTHRKKFAKHFELLEQAFAAVPSHPLGNGPTDFHPDYWQALDQVELTDEQRAAALELRDAVQAREVGFIATKARAAARKAVAKNQAEYARRMARRGFRRPEVA